MKDDYKIIIRVVIKMGIWKNFNHNMKELNEDKYVDILIIGGSLTGLLTAYYLKNKNICVVEARNIGSGTTLNTTAKITYLQSNIYSKIKSLRGKNIALSYLTSVRESIDEYIKIINEEKIDCDFVKTPSYIFASKKSDIKKVKKEVNLLKEFNINIKPSPLDININNYASYKVNDTYTFNPLKFLEGIYNILIKSNVPIFENTIIQKIKKENNVYKCLTNKGHVIKANKVIFASSYPYFIFPLLLPLKSYIEKSYIIVSESNYKNLLCINVGNPSYSCRFYKTHDKSCQISLGCSHNTAFKMNDLENFNKVKNMFKLKDENIVMKYSNTDIITADHMPLIGKIKENMYISLGYNTWGMTSSLIGARLISEIITKGSNKYSNLFNPKRINISNIIKLPIFLFSQIKSFTSSKVLKNKPWYSNKVKYKRVNGQTIGIYNDGENIYKVKNKCPHASCGLIFNETEKTWDCPCHSSKYNIEGKCIKGPSTKDINI